MNELNVCRTVLDVFEELDMNIITKYETPDSCDPISISYEFHKNLFSEIQIKNIFESVVTFAKENSCYDSDDKKELDDLLVTLLDLKQDESIKLIWE